MWSDEEWESRDNWNEWVDQIREVGDGNHLWCCDINMIDLKNVLKKMSPLKAAAPDGIPCTVLVEESKESTTGYIMDCYKRDQGRYEPKLALRGPYVVIYQNRKGH